MNSREQPGESLAIESTDIVRLVQQWLKEQGLRDTLRAMEKETGISNDTVVEDLDALMDEVEQGRWDIVVRKLSGVRPSARLLVDLYEQIVLELLEAQELEAARTILRETDVFDGVRERDIDRYLRLEKLSTQTSPLDAAELYPETSKERRRRDLASALGHELEAISPDRLHTLLGMSLKWMQQQGQLPPEMSFDLFRGVGTAKTISEEDTPPSESFAKIKFGDKSHAEVARFTPDGKHLVTGTVDGFIEVWDPKTGKLRTDLQYQKEDNIMMMDSAVLCLAVSRDSRIIASGSESGQIKIWELSTGKCTKSFDRAHGHGITSLAFSVDGTQVLSSSFDHLVRIHGLNSGRTLKEFRGHKSFVNCAIYSYDGSRILSCSSDGSVKIWNTKSSECLHTIHPERVHSEVGVTVQQIISVPYQPDIFLVCNKSPRGYLMNAQGKILREFHHRSNSLYLFAAVTAHGRYALFCREDGTLDSYRLETGKHEGTVKLHDPAAEILGIVHHPKINIFVSFTDSGELLLWRP